MHQKLPNAALYRFAAALLLWVPFSTIHADPRAGLYPDSRLTPGATDPRVNQNNIFQTICLHGYTKTVRPSFEQSNRLKHQVMNAYHVTGSIHDYELDHLIPLELGGCPDCITNLWPQRWASPGAHEKDDAEFFLHNQVCAGRLSLAAAQSQIAHDWYNVYLQMRQGRRFEPSASLLPGASLMPVRIYSLEETKALLKNTLARAFSRTPFRLYIFEAAGLDVHWIDGPSLPQVQHICKSFEGASLAPLTPMLFRSPDVNFQGQPSRFQVQLIRPFRRHTRKLLTKAALYVATECNLPLLSVDKKHRLIGGDHPVPFNYVRHSQTFSFSPHDPERYSELVLQAAAGLSLEAPAPVLLPSRSTQEQVVAL